MIRKKPNTCSFCPGSCFIEEEILEVRTTLDSVVSGTGSQGPEGPPGPQGPPGADGAQGSPGLPGSPGTPGAKGDKGDRGDQGLQGIQGLPGNDGTPGIQGIQGIPGPAGNDGSPGIQGLKGDTGDPGEQGIPGIQGLPGNDGATGTQGPKGDTGDQGIQGIQGIQGEIGPQGPAGGLGYAINVLALTSSPGDGATVYFGMLPKAPISTANVSKVHPKKAGTIKIAHIYCYAGTAGTNEAWSLYVRKNNTTDYLIQTLSVSASERIFTNSALSIAMNGTTDYFEIKSVQPTWGTNPLTCIYGGYVYIE